jgi:hypothetical protein
VSSDRRNRSRPPTRVRRERPVGCEESLRQPTKRMGSAGPRVVVAPNGQSASRTAHGVLNLSYGYFRNSRWFRVVDVYFGKQQVSYLQEPNQPIVLLDKYEGFDDTQCNFSRNRAAGPGIGTGPRPSTMGRRPSRHASSNPNRASRRIQEGWQPGSVRRARLLVGASDLEKGSTMCPKIYQGTPARRSGGSEFK